MVTVHEFKFWLKNIVAPFLWWQQDVISYFRRTNNWQINRLLANMPTYPASVSRRFSYAYHHLNWCFHFCVTRIVSLLSLYRIPRIRFTLCSLHVDHRRSNHIKLRDVNCSCSKRRRLYTWTQLFVNWSSLRSLKFTLYMIPALQQIKRVQFF